MLGRLVWLLSALLFGVVVQGCAVFTSYQTARVLPPGSLAPAFELGGGGRGEGFPVMLDLGPAVRVGVGV